MRKYLGLMFIFFLSAAIYVIIGLFEADKIALGILN